MTKKYAASITEIYFYSTYFGEWGDLEEKKIIFMEINTEKKNIKSKKPLKLKEVYNIFKNNEKSKMTIYFEPTIQKDPEKESYKSYNNIWISYLGGLYEIVDPLWEVEGKEGLEFKEDKWGIWKIEKYKNWKEMEDTFHETADSAKELKKYKNKWELFKFNYTD